MRIKILAFGITRDILGKREVEIELKPQATVADLRAYLDQHFPAFTELRSLAIALNSEYSEGNEVLSETDEIALIPPVSGG